MNGRYREDQTIVLTEFHRILMLIDVEYSRICYARLGHEEYDVDAAMAHEIVALDQLFDDKDMPFDLFEKLRTGRFDGLLEKCYAKVDKKSLLAHVEWEMPN